MKHLHIKLALVTALLSFALIPASAYDFEVDGIYYDVVSSNDNSCTVAGIDAEAIVQSKGEVVIPNTVTYGKPSSSEGKTYVVTAIADGAFNFFNEVNNVKKLVIEDGETTLTIGNMSSSTDAHGMFYDCPLKEVYIGRNLSYNTNDGGYSHSPFSAIDSLRKVTFGNFVTAIGDNAFVYCRNLSEIEIPSSVISIGKDAFSSCKNLSQIEIPSSVTSIGDLAFAYCYSLSEITIPNSVTVIEWGTFAECINLKTVTLPNTLTYIDGFAFYATNLSDITIPASVTYIGEYAFKWCNLKEITSLNPTPPTLLDSEFSDEQYASILLYVPQEAIAAYQAANKWKSFKNIRAISSTGIEEVKTGSYSQSAAIFDLQGRKHAKPQKGINIINGKKTVIK